MSQSHILSYLLCLGSAEYLQIYNRSSIGNVDTFHVTGAFSQENLSANGEGFFFLPCFNISRRKKRNGLDHYAASIKKITTTTKL